MCDECASIVRISCVSVHIRWPHPSVVCDSWRAAWLSMQPLAHKRHFFPCVTGKKFAVILNKYSLDHCPSRVTLTFVVQASVLLKRQDALHLTLNWKWCCLFSMWWKCQWKLWFFSTFLHYYNDDPWNSWKVSRLQLKSHLKTNHFLQSTRHLPIVK